VKNPITKVIDFFKKKSYWTSLSGFFNKDETSATDSRDYLDAYNSCFLVYSCIRKIAEKVANTEFKLYKVGAREIAEVENHPMLDLLAQVNPYTTKFEMLVLTQTYLEIFGNAYWLKVRGERSKKPLELWSLRPEWVKIIPGEEEMIAGYEYRQGGGIQKEFFPVEDVIHFKDPNPKSTLYGMSELEPMMDIIRCLVYSTRWNKNFFYNNARPDFLITNKDIWHDDEKKEFVKRWESRYGGITNAHRFGMLQGNIDIKEITRTMRDMEFSKLHEMSVDDILSGFGVPRAIVGMKGMNRAEAESQIHTFLAETVEPRVQCLIENINEFLTPEYGDNLHLEFESMVPEDREQKIGEYASALQNNWMVINEVRDLEGLPPLEGGWDIYMPMAMMPIGGRDEEERQIKIGGIDPKKYYKHKKDKEQRILRKRVLAGKRSLKLKTKLKKELVRYFSNNIKNFHFSEKQKENFWKEHAMLLTTDERMFVPIVRSLFKSQEKRVIDAVESQFTGKDIVGETKALKLNWSIERRVFAEVAMPIFTDVVKRRGQRAAIQVGMGAFNERTKPVQRFIDKKTLLFAEQVNKTTEKKLKKTLSEGVRQGEGVDDLTKRVQEIFKGRRKYESERIARTEMLQAHNGADLEAYKQSGVVEMKEWLATMDDRVRDEHAMMNGEKVKLNEAFSNGEQYPSEPNCRCSVLPIVE